MQVFLKWITDRLSSGVSHIHWSLPLLSAPKKVLPVILPLSSPSTCPPAAQSGEASPTSVPCFCRPLAAMWVQFTAMATRGLVSKFWIPQSSFRKLHLGIRSRFFYDFHAESEVFCLLSGSQRKCSYGTFPGPPLQLSPKMSWKILFSFRIGTEKWAWCYDNVLPTPQDF